MGVDKEEDNQEGYLNCIDMNEAKGNVSEDDGILNGFKVSFSENELQENVLVTKESKIVLCQDLDVSEEVKD